MIVPMKHVTLLCVRADREATVETVRRLGIVHVVPARAPEGENLEATRAQLAAAERAHTLLCAVAKVGKDERVVAVPADEVIERALALDTRRREYGEQAEACERELSEYAPFGEIDPRTVETLKSAGVHVRLGLAAGAKTLPAPDGFLLHILRRTEAGLAFALIAQQPFELADVDLDAAVTPVPLPARSRAESQAVLADTRRQIDALTAELAELAPASSAVSARAAELADAARFASVRAGMGDSQAVAFLQGWAPADTVDALRDEAAQSGWGVVFTDPRPGEQVPTLLRYRRWARPITALLDFLRIYPGYREDDVGAVFLIFFSLFFAMLVGDAVYGLLILTVAVVLRAKLPRVPGHVFSLLMISGGATLLWGVLSGNYLGIAPLPGFLTALKVDWLSDRDNVIELSFLIGVVHLTLAHVWNITQVRPRTKIIAQIGWIAVLWSMFLLARSMVLGHSLPSFVPYLLAGGAACVTLFMATKQEFKRDWINHALLPLTFIGNLVDVLSYVRLFAVGYASVAVVTAFNQMASSLGWHHPATAAAAVVLLLFAHALNLVLCALAVLVHAVRLNTLEFSTHKGLSWQGFRYEPFRASTTATTGPVSDHTSRASLMKG